MLDHAKGCFDSKDLWTRVSTYLERAINGNLAGYLASKQPGSLEAVAFVRSLADGKSMRMPGIALPKEGYRFNWIGGANGLPYLPIWVVLQ